MSLEIFTRNFVEEWEGNNVNINGAHINFDGRYGTQCMDLWNYWCLELGVKHKVAPHYDAASVWEDRNGTHYEVFDGILPDQPAKAGDVFIYNRKAWGTGYGHIGIVLKDNGNSITVLETNGLGDGYEDDYMNQYGSAPRVHTWPKTNLYGYLRYIEEDDMAITDKEFDRIFHNSNSNGDRVIKDNRAQLEALGKALAKELKIDGDKIAEALLRAGEITIKQK